MKKKRLAGLPVIDLDKIMREWRAEHNRAIALADKTPLRKTHFSGSSWVKDWHAGLRDVVRQLKALYRKRGMPDPDKMPAYKLSEEYDLLEQIFFTTFLPRAWEGRWKAIKREHDSMVVCSFVYPY